jgi:hypothetical protein
MWLSYNILPKDVAKSLDYAIALSNELEREYVPTNLWPLYDKFIDSTCILPAGDVYAEFDL